MTAATRTESARNFEFVGHSDQGGRSDGTQIMVSGGYAYIAHPFSHGFTVVDVRDPRAPRTVRHVPCSPGSWALALQVSGNYLTVAEEFDFFGLTDRQAAHFAASTGPGGGGIDSGHEVYGGRGRAYTAGLRVYDISDGAHPRPIGFAEVPGFGLHRTWWTGGRYLYASASLDGFNDHMLVSIDMADPAAPKLVGRCWVPGQWLAKGEEPTWPGRVALHHAIVSGDLAASAWRDGGMILLDLSDPAAPALRSRISWHPPYSGNTHTTLPLPDRGLVVVADEAAAEVGTEEQKRTWVVDVRAPQNPVPIATLPMPADQDYLAKGGVFGPHNLWENRPGGFVSSDLVFATYQSAGVRAFDLSDQYRPREVGHFVPAPPETMVDPRPGIPPVLHSSDLFVAADGLTYVIDYNAGLHILQWLGA